MNEEASSDSRRAGRFLFATWDGGGTVPPSLGLVAALIAAGHDVVVLGDDTMEQEVLATGATFTPWRHAPQARARDTARALVRDWEVKNPLKQVRQVGDLLFFGPADLHAADVNDAIEGCAPDALIVDALLTGAAAAGEHAGLPTAAVAPNVNLLRTPGVPPMGFGLRPRGGRLGALRDAALHTLNDKLMGTGTLNDTRRRLGLQPVGSLEKSIRRADRVIFLTSAAFDFPPTRPDPQVVYGGIPIPPNELGGTTGAAAWQPPWPADDRPKILLSLSTTYMRQEDLLRRLVDALAGIDVHAVVTVGPGMRGRPLPPPAPNVTLAEYVPHGAVLGHVDLVVTHGGHGTVVRSRAAGVPVLVVPISRDQPDNAARVVYHGVGAKMSPRSSVVAFRREIERLLRDATVRQRTQAMADRLRPDLGAPQAVAALTGLLSGPTGPSEPTSDARTAR